MPPNNIVEGPPNAGGPAGAGAGAAAWDDQLAEEMNLPQVSVNPKSTSEWKPGVSLEPPRLVLPDSTSSRNRR